MNPTFASVFASFSLYWLRITCPSVQGFLASVFSAFTSRNVSGCWLESRPNDRYISLSVRFCQVGSSSGHEQAVHQESVIVSDYTIVL